MGKPIAVLGCKLQILPPSTGTVTVTGVPDSNVMIENKPAFFGQIAFTIAGASTTGATGGTGGGSIMGTAVFNSNSNKPAVLLGDQVVVTVKGTTTSSPSSPIEWPLTVQITNAGQTSALAD